MISIIYDPLSGISFSDGKVEEYCNQIAKINEDITIIIGTSEIIACFRALVAEKKIDHNNITIKYYDKEYWSEDKIRHIKISLDGEIDCWPKGFCDHMCNYLDRIYNSR